MKISVAQTKPTEADVLANIGTHKKLIALAAAHEADAIFFPELSVTSYEPTLAKALAMTQDDNRLDDFQSLSNLHRMTIGVGVPIKAETGILIGMMIFQPQQPRQVYAKQILHEDELPYFIGGNKQTLLTIGNQKVAPAICYEALQPEHAQEAAELGATMYVTSVAKSQNGVDKARKHFPGIAKTYAMTVMMANCVGPCDNFESAGQTAVWDKHGTLIAQLDDKMEGLLVFDTETQEVASQSLSVPYTHQI